MVQTGITDEIEVKEKSGGSAVITDKFGVLIAGSHTHRQEVRQHPGIGQGPKYQSNIPGVTETTGGLSCMPHDLRFLQVFGSETTGSGTYTVTPDNTLPTYTYKQEKVDGGGTATLETFKFGSFTLRVSEGNELEAELEGMAEDFKFDETETITTESPGGDPRPFFDCTLKIGGTAVGSVDTFVTDFNRNLEAFKGIEDDTGAAKRKPTEIIEKLFDVSFRAVVNIENSRAWEEMLDDTTDPLEVQEDPATQDVALDVNTSAGSATFKVITATMEEVSSEMENDAEKRTATLRGVGQDWKATGDT